MCVWCRVIRTTARRSLWLARHHHHALSLRKYQQPPINIFRHKTAHTNPATGYDQWRPPHPLWSDPEFLDNFCTVFVSFVSQLNRKIRDLRLVRVCCSLNTASKCTKTHHFGGQKLFFLGRDLAHPPYPPTLDAYGAFSPPPY